MSENLELLEGEIRRYIIEEELNPNNLAQLGNLILRIEQFKYQQKKDNNTTKGKDVAPLPPNPESS